MVLNELLLLQQDKQEIKQAITVMATETLMFKGLTFTDLTDRPDKVCYTLQIKHIE